MEDDREEHWRKLCAEAANEQDPEKLLVSPDRSLLWLTTA
jgi:hypothetical protein